MEQRIGGCNHKCKVIRVEEGKRETLLGLLGLSMADVMIYHLQCEKCGFIFQRIMDIAQRNREYKVLKETKWLH